MWRLASPALARGGPTQAPRCPGDALGRPRGRSRGRSRGGPREVPGRSQGGPGPAKSDGPKSSFPSGQAVVEMAGQVGPGRVTTETGIFNEFPG